MKHPDWPSFLAAIIASPDDDTLRLVAADFLEEHGEADRAAFIRVQVELAQLASSGLAQSDEAAALRQKERGFVGPKSERPHLWAAEECSELVRPDPRGRLRFEGTERLTWRRGFVEEVRCPAAEWLRHGVAVRARNPVRTVRLTDCGSPARDAWYAGLDSLRGLRTVDLDAGEALANWLRSWLPDTEVTAFAF